MDLEWQTSMKQSAEVEAAQKLIVKLNSCFGWLQSKFQNREEMTPNLQEFQTHELSVDSNGIIRKLSIDVIPNMFIQSPIAFNAHEFMNSDVSIPTRGIHQSSTIFSESGVMALTCIAIILFLGTLSLRLFTYRLRLMQRHHQRITDSPKESVKSENRIPIHESNVEPTCDIYSTKDMPLSPERMCQYRSPLDMLADYYSPVQSPVAQNPPAAAVITLQVDLLYQCNELKSDPDIDSSEIQVDPKSETATDALRLWESRGIDTSPKEKGNESAIPISKTSTIKRCTSIRNNDNFNSTSCSMAVNQCKIPEIAGSKWPLNDKLKLALMRMLQRKHVVYSKDKHGSLCRNVNIHDDIDMISPIKKQMSILDKEVGIDNQQCETPSVTMPAVKTYSTKKTPKFGLYSPSKCTETAGNCAIKSKNSGDSNKQCHRPKFPALDIQESVSKENACEPQDSDNIKQDTAEELLSAVCDSNIISSADASSSQAETLTDEPSQISHATGRYATPAILRMLHARRPVGKMPQKLVIASASEPVTNSTKNNGSEETWQDEISSGWANVPSQRVGRLHQKHSYYGSSGLTPVSPRVQVIASPWGWEKQGSSWKQTEITKKTSELDQLPEDEESTGTEDRQETCEDNGVPTLHPQQEDELKSSIFEEVGGTELISDSEVRKMSAQEPDDVVDEGRDAYLSSASDEDSDDNANESNEIAPAASVASIFGLIPGNSGNLVTLYHNKGFRTPATVDTATLCDGTGSTVAERSFIGLLPSNAASIYSSMNARNMASIISTPISMPRKLHRADLKSEGKENAGRVMPSNGKKLDTRKAFTPLQLTSTININTAGSATPLQELFNAI